MPPSKKLPIKDPWKQIDAFYAKRRATAGPRLRNVANARSVIKARVQQGYRLNPNKASQVYRNTVRIHGSKKNKVR